MKNETPENWTDRELIAEYLSGNASAFDALYARYKLPLYSFLNRYVGNQAAADDVFQQTWMRALKNLGKYENQDKFLSWLCRIGRNLALDSFRKAKVKAESPFEDGAENEIPVSAEPWREIADRELEQAVDQAARALPEEQKQVFFMRKAGIAFKEIAAAQNCSLNTALGRMNYAVKTLRNKLRAVL